MAGVGAYERLHPDPDVIGELQRRGIAAECPRTQDAIHRYRELDERHIAAALHLSC